MSFVPRYKQISNKIERMIETGHFDPSKPLPSEHELSEIFCASRSTISKALKELRFLNIIYTIHGSGSYIDTRYLSTQTNDSTNIISILLPFADYERSARIDESIILKTLEKHLSKNNFFPIVHYCYDTCDSFYESLKKIQQLPHEGLIAYPPQDASLLTRKFPDIISLFSKNPTILLDQTISEVDIPCVHPDFYFDGALAAKHLLEYNYTRIFFCSAVTINYNSSTNSCYAGFTSTLKKYSHTNNSPYIYLKTFGTSERDKNIEYQCEILKQLTTQYPNERLGFVCYCDYMGVELFDACKKLGLRVPEDIGIIGFGNANLPLSNGKYLSTVDYNLEANSIIAAKTIISLIHKRNHSSKLCCEGTLLPRSTTSKI